MAKKNNVITIDLNIWTTQKEKAKELGLTPEAISRRIKRTTEGKNVKFPLEGWHIEELNLTLVRK